ncbi:MAG: hypothetical protein AAGN46_14985 [Acidobacteriota bacterium]
MLFAQGKLEESLRIRREEQLPVYELLRDVRSLAITRGKIADVLFARGDLEEALRIRREEELPVYARLGDVRALAVTHGQIADVLFAQGEREEALRLLQDETLPAARRLQDPSMMAQALWSSARIRLAQDELDASGVSEALKELQESFELNSRLQRADGIAASGRLLGQTLVASGLPEPSAGVLDASASAFERLGHVAEASAVRAFRQEHCG